MLENENAELLYQQGYSQIAWSNLWMQYQYVGVDLDCM